MGDAPTERLIRVTVPGHLAEAVGDRMWQWGVRGVAESETDDGRVVLSTSVGNDGDAIAQALRTLDPSWTWSVDDVDATASDAWRDHAEPIRCGDDLVIAPAWVHPGPDEVGSDDTVVLIEPGAAFGLGDHPTTRSSVRALADEIERRRHADHPIDTLLDVGCGTGVLGIVGALRGVGRVRSIDISPAAVAVTVDNARRNGVDERIVTDATPISRLAIPAPDGYDVIVANILAPTLVSLSRDLRRLLAPGGSLIISGVLSAGQRHGHAHVLEALAPLQARSTIDDAGWATVTLTD